MDMDAARHEDYDASACGDGSQSHGCSSSHDPLLVRVVNNNNNNKRNCPDMGMEASSRHINKKQKKQQQQQEQQQQQQQAKKWLYLPEPITRARSYQLQALAVAKERNTIVYLGTGCGKTLIAVLLMKEIAGDVKEEGSNDIMIFLAPTVQLVIQQAGVIKINTDLKVTELYGSMGVDAWKQPQWDNQLSQHEVFVMTPDVLENALTRAHLKLENVRLLVFDECHHAKGHHCYAKIMNCFYQRCKRKPKIFGMTASLLTRKLAISMEDCEDQISTLEHILDSKVYTVEDKYELESIPTPKHETVFYSRPLFDFTQVKCILDSLTEKYKKPVNGIDKTKNQYGDYGVYIKSLEDTITSLSGNIHYCLENLGLYSAYKATQIYKDKCNFESLGTCIDSGMLIKIHQQKNYFLADVLDNIVAAFPQGFKKLHSTGRNEIDGVKCGLITPKMQTLFKCLISKKGSKRLCCIIFVERVITTAVISSLIKESDCLSDIKCDYLTGASGLQDISSAKSKQDTIARFRAGEIKFLITTNISEEGIDVQNCNHIIQFDFPQSSNSFTQSRGRLRDEDSVYTILLERNNSKQIDLLFNFLKSQRIMQDVVSNRDAKIILPKLMKRTDTVAYHVPETGATLQLDSSINFIHHYCSKLPGDMFFHPKPKFEYIKEGENLFRCILQLPPNAPIKKITGCPAQGKHNAQQLACFEAFKKLLELKEIDEHLHNIVPQAESDEEDISDENKTSATGTTKRKELHHTTKVQGFAGSWVHKTGPLKFYQYEINFLGQENAESNTNLVLLVEKKLEDDASNTVIDLYLTRGRVVRAQVSPSDYIEFDPSQVKVAKAFQEILFNGMFGKLMIKDELQDSTHCLRSIYQTDEVDKLWVPDNLYFLLPMMTNESCIDWKSVSHCADAAEYFRSPQTRIPDSVVDQGIIHLAYKQIKESDLIGKAIIATHTGKLYCVMDVLHDKTIESPFPDKSREYTTYADFYRRKYGITLKKSNQPLLQLKQTHRPYNLLNPFGKTESGKKDNTEMRKVASIEMPAELCLNLEVSDSTIRALYLVPSVMHRIETVTLASEFQQQIPKEICPRIPATLIMHALITSRCNETFSLERLELLGDSVLKYAVSCRLFVKYGNKHEGYLSTKRSKAVRNSTLHKQAVDHKLVGYIRDEPFDSQSWVAPGTLCRKVPDTCHCMEREFKSFQNGEYVVKIGKKCNEGHRWLCSKTISDCVEALIGAYMVAGELDAAYKFMKWLNVKVEYDVSELKLSSINSNILNRVDLNGLESILGYCFNNKGLLVEAITHASQQDFEGHFCYQRLEFLGDAALDLLITRHIFNENPHISPGELTDLRAAAVNNYSFAHTTVKHNLQKYLRHCSENLLEQITNFVNFVKCNQVKKEQGNPCSFGENIETPKVLGDLLESIAGAILVDSNFQLEKVWQIMKPLLSPIVTPKTIQLHPVRVVTELCNLKGFNLNWTKTENNINAREKSTTAEVALSDGTIIVGKSTNPKSKYAKKDCAIQILKELKERGIEYPVKSTQTNEQGCEFPREASINGDANGLAMSAVPNKTCHSKQTQIEDDADDAMKAMPHNQKMMNDEIPLETTSNAGTNRNAVVDGGGTSERGEIEIEVQTGFREMPCCAGKNIQPVSKAEGASHLQNSGKDVVFLNMGKGGPRQCLFDLCKKRFWPMPTLEETKSTGQPQSTSRNPSFTFSGTLKMRGRDPIDVIGQAKKDKNSAKDSVALILLLELQKQDLCILKTL